MADPALSNFRYEAKHSRPQSKSDLELMAKLEKYELFSKRIKKDHKTKTDTLVVELRNLELNQVN